MTLDNAMATKQTYDARPYTIVTYWKKVGFQAREPHLPFLNAREPDKDLDWSSDTCGTFSPRFDDRVDWNFDSSLM